MKKKLAIVLFIMVLIPILTQAQRWKRQRWDLVGGIGTANFLGDLGGGGEKASHFFGVRDIDIAVTRPLFNVGLRYKLAEIVSTHVGVNYGWLAGDDINSSDIGRKTRNLSFRSYILESSLLFEISFIKERIGSRYAISRGSILNLINAYFFFGGAWIKFNPRAEFQGQWFDLQPLGTEGQGQIDMPPKYKLSAWALPVGIGVKYTLTTAISVGLDFGVRYTTSDYIDDVSTKYYNYPQSGAVNTYDPKVINFSDRSINIDGSERTTKHATNDQEPRGGSNFNDAYSFMTVSISYKLKTGRSGLPKFR